MFEAVDDHIGLGEFFGGGTVGNSDAFATGGEGSFDAVRGIFDDHATVGWEIDGLAGF